MNPLLAVLRNLLLILLASWGVVDSAFSYVSNAPDPDSETEAYAPLEAGGSRKQLSPDCSLCALRLPLVDRNAIVQSGRCAASIDAIDHTSAAHRLYALMSLRR